MHNAKEDAEVPANGKGGAKLIRSSASFAKKRRFWSFKQKKYAPRLRPGYRHVADQLKEFPAVGEFAMNIESGNDDTLQRSFCIEEL